MDTACTSKKAAGNAVRMHIEYKVDAFIGPPCSIGKYAAAEHAQLQIQTFGYLITRYTLYVIACRTVAELASFWNKPIISWVATDPDFVDAVTYSTLARTLGPFNKMGVFLLEVRSQDLRPVYPNQNTPFL